MRKAYSIQETDRKDSLGLNSVRICSLLKSTVDMGLVLILSGFYDEYKIKKHLELLPELVLFRNSISKTHSNNYTLDYNYY